MFRSIAIASAIAVAPILGSTASAATTPSDTGASITATVNVLPASIVNFQTDGVYLQANYGWPWIATIASQGQAPETLALNPGFTSLPQISGETVSVSPSF